MCVCVCVCVCVCGCVAMPMTLSMAGGSFIGPILEVKSNGERGTLLNFYASAKINVLLLTLFIYYDT